MNADQIYEELRYLHNRQRLSAGEALCVLSMPFSTEAEQRQLRDVVLELLVASAIDRSPRERTWS